MGSWYPPFASKSSITLCACVADLRLGACTTPNRILVRNPVFAELQSTTGSDVTATVQIHGSGTVREIKSRVEEDGSGAADIKLCNTDLADDDESGATMAAAASSGGSATFGVDDLINLTHLHEPAILHALCLRYSADEIYTYTGADTFAAAQPDCCGLEVEKP